MISGLPKIRATFFGGLHSRDYSVLGSIMGSPYLGNYHIKQGIARPKNSPTVLQATPSPPGFENAQPIQNKKSLHILLLCYPEPVNISTPVGVLFRPGWVASGFRGVTSYIAKCAFKTKERAEVVNGTLLVIP